MKTLKIDKNAIMIGAATVLTGGLVWIPIIAAGELYCKQYKDIDDTDVEKED